MRGVSRSMPGGNNSSQAAGRGGGWIAKNRDREKSRARSVIRTIGAVEFSYCERDFSRLL
jgi:hypothetical protein